MLLISNHLVISSDKCSNLRYSNDPLVAKQWVLKSCRNFSKDLLMLPLLVRPFQTLNTVKNGVLYISHVMSRNKIEDGDLDAIMSIRESWIRESLSEGKWSQSLNIEDIVVETISVWSYLKGAGV